ncbi:hypothetical protein GZH82_00705 [Staphylococcus ursi]|uniref:hypothetical protein n=1 Tax=Staphylococcus sp. MI 10-1553 TaxID=1912064 RepID=UPI0013990AF2|nr:hypothetical protein [Staphylococcus sp. MI 10-1553]QHW35998.1 hypothetical protein GZH82_00705 [Staphylococcus sp. MI 10-1553]
MEALFEFVKSLSYIIVSIPTSYFIAFGVTIYALMLCIFLVRAPIKTFFDRHYYGGDSDQMPFVAGP